MRIVRLDAVGYVIKKRGTSGFMVEPEIYEFLAWLTAQAESLGLIALPEVHDTWATHQRLSGARDVDLRFRPPRARPRGAAHG